MAAERCERCGKMTTRLYTAASGEGHQFICSSCFVEMLRKNETDTSGDTPPENGAGTGGSV